MHIPPIAFKRKHHRLLLCTDAKKKDLLAKLLHENEDRRIAVVSVDDSESIYVPESVVLLNDDALPEARYDLLIGYDLPLEPEAYFRRLALAGETALTLMSEIDRPNLLGIEAAMGRAITQELILPFAPAAPKEQKPLPKAHGDKSAKPPQKTGSKPFGKKAPFAKDAKPAAKRTPKESGVSRYIGTDENGKPKFAKKPNQRNHRHDGSLHTDESLAAKKAWEERRKKEDGKPSDGGKKKPPFDKGKKSFDGKKPSDKSSKDKPSAPKAKRPVRRLKADALKPKKEES